MVPWHHPKAANLPFTQGADRETRGQRGKQRQATVSDMTDDIWPEAVKQLLTRCCVGN